MPDATLLLPNYNNEHCLPVMFDYLRRNVDCTRYAFLMVDDGSEDASIRVAKEEIARTKFASAEIIERKHFGIVTTLNAGLEAVRTEFILRLDGDSTAETPGWADRFCGWLRKYPEVGVVGAQAVFDFGHIHGFGRSVVSELGLHDIGCTPHEPTGKRTFDSLVFRPKAHFLDCPPHEVDTILGICTAFRKSEALAAGGFDPRYDPVWIEDDDFGLSIRRLGRRVVLDTAVQVTHRISLRGSRNPAEGGRQEYVRALLTPSGLRAAIKARTPTRIWRAAAALAGCSTRIPTLEDLLIRESNPWRMGILTHHYASWREKWGFDPLNPDMLTIYNKYWDNDLCWRRNPAKLEQSVSFFKNATPV